MFKWKKCDIHGWIKYSPVLDSCPLCNVVANSKFWMDTACDLDKKWKDSIEHNKEIMAENNQLDKHIGIYEEAMCELEEFCDRMFVDKERCEDCLGGCVTCDNFRVR